MDRIKPFTMSEARKLFPFPKDKETESMTYEFPREFVDFIDDGTGIDVLGQFNLRLRLCNDAVIVLPLDAYSLHELARVIRKELVRQRDFANEILSE